MNQKTPSNPKEIHRYSTIQAIRAVATLLVLWVHFRFAGKKNAYVDHEFVLTGLGGCGVDMFFVVSGFVMVISTLGRNQSPRIFLSSRAIRVLPLYFLYSLPFLVLSFLGDFNWIQIANTFLFFPFFDRGDYTSPAHPYGWTIAFEVWFYTVFCLFFLKNLSAKHFFGRLLALAIVVSIINYYLNSGWFLPRFLTCPLILEFLMGCLIGIIHKKANKTVAIFSFLVGLAMYVFLAPAHGDLTNYGSVINDFHRSMQRCFYWGVPAALVILALTSLEYKLKFRLPRIVSLAGDSSYSLYLAQPFLIFSARYLLISGSMVVDFLVYIIFSVFSGVVLYKYIELPLTQYIKKSLIPRLS